MCVRERERGFMCCVLDGAADKKAATGAGPDFNPAFVSDLSLTHILLYLSLLFSFLHTFCCVLSLSLLLFSLYTSSFLSLFHIFCSFTLYHSLPILPPSLSLSLPCPLPLLLPLPFSLVSHTARRIWQRPTTPIVAHLPNQSQKLVYPVLDLLHMSILITQIL